LLKLSITRVYVSQALTDLIAGDIPSFKLFESDKILAYLDIQPLSKGHAVRPP
jgi:diadenosine tetraphosphate (Ap4A) HIT family hydrolase